MIRTATIVEDGDWEVKKLYEDEEFSHYVLKYTGAVEFAYGFDTVTAGGLLELKRGDNGQMTFSSVIDGTNEYVNDADMPKRIFDTLKDIGPY